MYNSKLIDLLQSIKNKFVRLTNIEKKRLASDLDVIYERLLKKEYTRTGFSNNKFDVPDRTHEFYVNLNFYCQLGKDWAQLLKQININNYSEILDLCPGFMPKVELGLFYLEYKGTLIGIDKNQQSLIMLDKFMQLFNPKYKFIKKKWDLYKNFKNKYPVVMANHMIDDLVIDYFATKFNLDIKDIYKNESSLVKFWNLVLENKTQNIEEVANKIAPIFDRLVEANGYLILTQYKSYFDKILNMNKAFYFNRILFRKIIKSLESKNYTNEKLLVENAFDNYKGILTKLDCCILRKL